MSLDYYTCGDCGQQFVPSNACPFCCDTKKELKERSSSEERERILKILDDYPNPYPKDIFIWNSKVPTKITVGRFNEFVNSVVENTRDDLKKQIKEEPFKKRFHPKTKPTCKRCWTIGQIQKDCPDCKGTGEE